MQLTSSRTRSPESCGLKTATMGLSTRACSPTHSHVTSHAFLPFAFVTIEYKQLYRADYSVWIGAMLTCQTLNGITKRLRHLVGPTRGKYFAGAVVGVQMRLTINGVKVQRLGTSWKLMRK